MIHRALVVVVVGLISARVGKDAESEDPPSDGGAPADTGSPERCTP